MNNPIITLELTDMAHGGSALGRADDKVIFVRYAIPGERVLAEIVEDKGRFANAVPVEILEPSRFRVDPPCPYFGSCGGCHWQHIDYPAQLDFKAAVMRDQLERIGRFDAPQVAHTIYSPDEWRYRIHATFTPLEDGRLGFWSDDNAHVVPVDDCLICRPEIADMLEALEFEPEMMAGIEKVRLQAGGDGEGMVILYARDDEIPPGLVLDRAGVSVNFVLPDNEPVNLIGESHALYEIGGRAFRVTAGGFFQVNAPQAEALIEQVLDRLALEGRESVLDLYAGVGLFTTFIAEQASLVTAVESYPPAVTDADLNAGDLENVDLIEGAVDDVLPLLSEPYDAVVVDPPRAGLSHEVSDALIAGAPPKIVYVSCDPATFARDARKLCAAGYHMGDVQPVDMFPQTFHIESVTTFTR